MTIRRKVIPLWMRFTFSGSASSTLRSVQLARDRANFAW
jgi:hypothetical protein